MRRICSAAALTGLMLLLSACGTKPQPRTPPPVVVAPRPVPVPTPAQYLQRAGSIDLFVVRASELALQRSSDAGTRALAERLLAEHRGLAAQLSMAGRRLDLLPGATLLPEQQTAFDMLARTAAFDTSFQQRLLVAHRQAVVMHGNFARAGASPTLRPVAANAERVEVRHLAELIGP